MPTPGPPTPIDPNWKAAMAAATSTPVEAMGLNPSGAEHACRLSAAALEVAAHPARYGLHPWDGLQAVRLYYTS